MNYRDTFYYLYLKLHILITVLVDAAIALPEKWQFPVQTELLRYHVKQNSDVLVEAAPIWLKAFVWVEILLQLPFFAWASNDLYNNRKRVWPAMVAYGTLASTTTFACLAEIAYSDVSSSIKNNLLAIYLPTFLIPLVMAIDFGMRIASELSSKQKLE